MNKRAALFALICALVGLGASTAAAYTHYRLLADPNYSSFCDVNAAVSCTHAYMSRFGTFQGVPVALFGLLWFVVATLLAVTGMTARDSVREDVPGYLFVMSTLALAAVLYLGYASFVILKTVCVLCLTTYAAVIGIFLVSGAATSFTMTTLPRRAARDLRVLVGNPLAIGILVLFFAGAGSTLAFFPREGSVVSGATTPTAEVTQDQRSELERFMATAPRVPLVVPREGAKVLIVKFNDFQCPACGQSYLQYKPILAKWEASNPGAVKMVLKDYPLNRDCNDAIQQTLHPAACEAAVAVRLARLRNKGDAMEEWLYTHQPAMTPPSVRQAAKDIGGITDFDEKYAVTLTGVKSDIALGKSLGIRATPTFFINGVKFDSAILPQYFDAAIAYELQHAK
jgi:uncharacterized membrane protein/protein-disulfide isomerase